MKVVLSVCLTEQQYAIIDGMSRETGLAKADIIRRALDAYVESRHQVNS